MDQTKKFSVYNSTLNALRSGIAKINDELLIYKFTVDLLSKIPQFHWIGVYFYNPVTKEFYLGYNIGTQAAKTMVRYDQLGFPTNPFDAKIEIINNIEAEQTDSISPQATAEAHVLIKQGGTILGMIVIGSEATDNFNEVDRSSLIEIVDTVAEKVRHI
ncbi:MAG: GAF domain-containing protein [Candidatus Hodarchaeota archaeon]